MSELQFFIRHKEQFMQEKFILVFKSDAAVAYFKKAIPGTRFESLTSEQARHAAMIGINGKVIPYGYTYLLSDEEMDRLSTDNWEQTAQLLAENNERMYQKSKRG